MKLIAITGGWNAGVLVRREADEDHWADDNDPEDRNGDEGDQSKH